MFESLRKIKVKSHEDADRALERAYGAINILNRSPILNGVFVTATLASGENALSHKLGRTPLGWYIVDRSTAATVHRDPADLMDSRLITLTASGAVTLTLWVF